MILLGTLSTDLAATAQEGAGKVQSDIRDRAGLFSGSAVQAARSELERIERNYKVPVTVETIDSLKGEGIDDASFRRAKQLNHQGVYILISKADRKAEVIASNPLAKDLDQPRRHAIRDALINEFKAGRMDDGLKKSVEATATQLAQVLPGVKPLTIGTPAPTPPAATSTSPMIPTFQKPSSSPLVLRQQVRLTLGGAKKVLEAAEAKAAEMKWKMNIAVVDDGGHMIAFVRMDGARPASVATATTKAITAATFRQATGPLPVGAATPDLLLNISVQNAAAASGGKITTLLGGIPIEVDGQIIGAVGVGGGSGEQDAVVARAGVDALLAELKKTAPLSGQNPVQSGYVHLFLVWGLRLLRA